MASPRLRDGARRAVAGRRCRAVFGPRPRRERHHNTKRNAGPRRTNEDAFHEGETFMECMTVILETTSPKSARELHARFEASDGDTETALRAAFLRLDADYCSAASRNEASPDAGATALALVVEPSTRRIIVANCGDCAAVLSRNGSAVSLSKAHSPIPHSEEHERVISAGGWVTSETDLCVGRLRSMDLEDPEISRSIQDRVRLNGNSPGVRGSGRESRFR